ncbi:MAG: site-specific DNA-methyltransferase [Brevundimonas sp.]|uniref:site-specific DNA-methyltransferase n=1 Tax=Brevundimonas sp. TaxID=1871086 RepID=UPI000DAFE69C|nr:site-specific DNA-methyltransferase [Brevundimonas sp.]PZT94595.1 MAG: site-specific DNA-methyltransferase [Brevundimonas sp.]
MPTLEFKGKPFVYSHHLAVPFRELRVVADKSAPGPAGPALDDSLVIHGDNLHALKALLPRYAGKVDVIYIDPPYNTGKDDWRYNDRVDSPLMNSWLGSLVNKEDMERHDKWLCMMWPRLHLLYDLLSPSGVLFVSIDDNEAGPLKALLGEIFGEDNWLGTIVWKNATDNNPTRIAIEHEYVHVWARSKEESASVWKAPLSDVKDVMLAKGEELLATFKGDADLSAAYRVWHKSVKSQLGPLAGYEMIDRKGIYAASRSVHNPGKQGYDWELLNPLTQTYVPKPLMGYRFPEETRDQLLAEDRIIFSDDPGQLIRLKTYLETYQEKMPSVVEIDGRRGANELRQLSAGMSDLKFKNPKTFTLIEWLLSYVAKPDALVLDSFAGSGTTAHAVLSLNKADGGDRRFILVEAGDYADGLTAERVRRTIKGVPAASDAAIREGLGGSFSYCELGEEMNIERFFAGEGAEPGWSRLAEYVAYTATGATLSVGEEGADGYAGAVAGFRLHLIYRPDQTWMRSNAAMLDMATAERIAAAAEGKPVLIFAAGKFVAQKTLSAMGVTFCQLPYAIHRILGDGTETGPAGDAA